MRVHIVGSMPREYSGILGCDLLGLFGGRVRFGRNGWHIRMGSREFRCHGELRGTDQIGVVERAGDWRHTLGLEFADVFYREGERLGVTGRTMHEVPLKQERATYVKERRYPQALRHHIREELADLKRQGIIVDSTSPFNSPLWIVPKKSAPGDTAERYRVVIDYRQLNDNTVDERYPIPRFEDILDRLGGATIFSTLDLKSGYHQIRMHPRDQHKTAFTFERGHYEFTRMPFGLKNAPITFQRFMDEFLRGLDEAFCQIYMDDLLVFSASESQHQDHLRRVFARMREFGLKLSKEKSLLGRDEIAFLGHVVSREGVRPDRSKVEAINRMAVPTDVKGIRRLLGSLNYYRRFVPDMAAHLVPLNNLLKKGSKVVVTPDIEEKLRRCMDALMREPVLAFPDFAKTFTVTTDASEYALGAVLSQEGEQGDRPVAYASRRLTDAESRYSALERELLGIVWAIDHFRPYVFGRRFRVQTDHRPLQWYGKLKESSARVTRWKEMLAQYNFEVIYKPGKENVVADWLSRALVVNAMEEEGGAGPSRGLRDFVRAWTPEHEGGMEPDAEDEQEGSPGLERPAEMEILEEPINNKAAQIIWKTMTEGLTRVEYARYGKAKITTIWSTPGIRDEFVCRALNDASRPGATTHLYVGNAIIWEKIKRLWRSERLGLDRTFIRCTVLLETVREPERQTEITLAYHQGKTNHRGVPETVQALKRRYFWWGMEQTVRTVVGQCQVCLTTKYDRHPPQGMQEETPTAESPLGDLQVDTFTWRGHKWVTMLDTFSKVAMAHRVRDRSAEAVLSALRTWFRVYGVPDTIASDAGREFDNTLIRDEMRALGVRWHMNTPGHPKSRGGVERLHSTLSDHLRIYQAEHGLDPDIAMEKAVAAYNHSIHTATGFAPFEVLFGLRGRQRDVTATAICSAVRQEAFDRRVALGTLWETVRRRLVKGKRDRVTRDNARVRDRFGDLRIGTIVYRRVGSNRSKEPVRYEGPFRVVVIREHNLVTIESVKEPRKRRTVHLEQLKLPLEGSAPS